MSFPPLGRLGLVLLALAAAPARAEPTDPPLLPQPLGVTELFSATERDGLGLGGFDPISYRLGTKPQVGSHAYECVWRGLVWRFASAANRAAFLQAPETYAPRIGGYDAERIASDVLVAADPEIFVVRGGGLYLFRNAEHRRRFLDDEALLGQAEKAWIEAKTRLVQG
jgi:YHS domain-containing protein